jgi:hypothetical protein
VGSIGVSPRLKVCQRSLLNRQTIFAYLHLKFGAAANAEGWAPLHLIVYHAVVGLLKTRAGENIVQTEKTAKAEAT